MYRRPGPVCAICNDGDDLDDGTMARCFTPFPGTVGQDGNWADQDTTKPKILTGADILQIAPGAGDQAATIASALNQATTDAGITNRIGQSMLIAQCAHESGGFVGQRYVESGVESRVVFNPGTDLEIKFKVLTVQTNKMERYLHGHNVAVWRQSQARFVKAKAEYEKANPGKPFEKWTGDKKWTPVSLTDYLPGDQELPYWKLWYDPASPYPARSRMAKANGNVEEGDGLKYIGRGFIQLTWRANYRAAGVSLQLDLEKNPAAAADLQNAIRIAAWYWKSRGLNHFTAQDTVDNFKNVTRKINPGLAGLAERQKYYKKIKSLMGIGAL